MITGTPFSKLLLLSFLATALLSTFPSVDADAVHIDLTRRNPTRDLKKLAAAATRTRAKYTARTKGLRRRGDTPLTDVVSYYRVFHP
jgi:hypothetical protein